MQNKGQFLTTEFLFGTVIFSVLLLTILIAFNDTNNVLEFKQSDNKIYQFAYNISEQLVSVKGVPENWDELNLNDVQLIGLAKSKNELDIYKLQKLLDLNSDYNNIKDKLSVGPYDLYFNFVDSVNGNLIYEFGQKANSESTVALVTRYITLDKNIMKLNLMVWR